MAVDSGTINELEILMQIREDVSSIKTDMANIKNNQQKDKEEIGEDIADVYSDCNRALKLLEDNMNTKINDLQSVQDTLAGEVDVLKHKEEKEDARKYRTIIAYLFTAIGGMIVAKIPEIIKTIYTISIAKG